MAAGPDDVSFQGKTGSSRPDDQNDANGPTPDIAPCRCHAALMHGAEAKASAPLCSDALPLYHHAKMTGIQRSLRQGGGFHASQHYRLARAPVVGSGANRLRGRAATG